MASVPVHPEFTRRRVGDVVRELGLQVVSAGDQSRRVEDVVIAAQSVPGFLDTLQEDPAGRGLITSPSLSPENQHPHGSALCAGPAMDRQILTDLFAATATALRLTGGDEAFASQWAPGIGVEIMGRNKFTPSRGPWPDDGVLLSRQSDAALMAETR